MNDQLTQENYRYAEMDWDMLARLESCRASGAEVLAYQFLAMYEDPDNGPCHRCVLASRAERIGMTSGNFTTTLHRFSKKRFTARDGKPYPPIVRVKRGHNGSAATYYDNIFADTHGYPLVGADETLGASLTS